MSENYLDGYGGETRTPPPRPGPGGWMPGDSEVLVRALCCPACGSVDVRNRDNGRTQIALRFECGDCAHAWRASLHMRCRAIILR